jgi:hypothetical protein
MVVRAVLSAPSRGGRGAAAGLGADRVVVARAGPEAIEDLAVEPGPSTGAMAVLVHANHEILGPPRPLVPVVVTLLALPRGRAGRLPSRGDAAGQPHHKRGSGGMGRDRAPEA